MIHDNVQMMDQALSKSQGMDIIIISTGSKQLEEAWENRFQYSRKEIAKPDASIIVIHEDWLKGAGNGLGTLYAYQKAREKGKKLFGFDLYDRQKEGASIAIYHTAGIGSRLYPLTASEYGNKPGVILPGPLNKDDPLQLITTLEAVIRQTAIYAPSRKGRLSVFWGDQLFIPSKNSEYEPKYHVDILAMVSQMPSKLEWESRKLENYGLITLGENVKQIEKCDYATLKELIAEKKIQIQKGLGISMGSFSLSTPMTFELLHEFSDELQQKKEKIDSDTYWWMPLTLDFESYLNVMQKKQSPVPQIRQHFQRMQNFKEKFCKQYPDLELFGAVDIGSDSYWWDYGTNDSYFQNIIKLTQQSKEADIMKRFFKLHQHTREHEGITHDESSCLLNCHIRSGRIKNSVLIGVDAEFVDVEDCVILNTSAKTIQGQHKLIYNVVEHGDLRLDNSDIRADMFLPDSRLHLKLHTQFGRNGKDDWKTKLSGNIHSWEELDQLLKKIDIVKAKHLAEEERRHNSEGIVTGVH